MEHLQAIVIGWAAIHSLGIGGLIWRSINLFFDVKELKKKIVELEEANKTLQSDNDKKFGKIETDNDKKFEALESSIDKKFEKLETDNDKKFEALESSIDKKFEKLEERETKFEARFEEMSKTQQDMRESQIKQQASLDQIKEGLSVLTNQLLEKKDNG